MWYVIVASLVVSALFEYALLRLLYACCIGHPYNDYYCYSDSDGGDNDGGGVHFVRHKRISYFGGSDTHLLNAMSD
jgi:hypothetical protein